MSATLTLVIASFLVPSDASNENLVKKELEEFQGTWVIVANTQEGKDTPESLRESKRYRIKGDHYAIYFGDAEKPIIEFRIKVDPTRKPKAIDMIGLKTDTVLLSGLYEFEGDSLKLCLPVGKGDRPKEIKSEPGSRSGIIVYKRVKE